MGELKSIFKRKNIKFEKVANMWLESKKKCVKESTYYNYMFKINKYIIPEFKGIDIISIHDYNEFINKLSKKLSASTVKDIIIVLKAILKYYEDEYGHKLKVKKIKLPKKEKTKLDILNQKEQKKLEEYCENEGTLLAYGIIICLNTGLRIGEICALKWENVDLVNRKIYVENTVQRIYKDDKRETEVITESAKTLTAIRTIPMNKRVFKCLQNIKKKNKDDEFVIVQSNGNRIEPKNYQNYLRKILKINEIKKCRFHMLRHTFASNCIEIGMDAKTLSEILGHSNVNTTLNIYVHSSEKLKKDYLERLNQRIN